MSEYHFMTNTSKDNHARISIEWLYDFEKDVIKWVKDIESDEANLIETARNIPFTNRSETKSWWNRKLLNIIDENENIISMIKVSNGENIAPEVTNPVIENMVVVSVWMKWDNLWSLLRAISTK